MSKSLIAYDVAVAGKAIGNPGHVFDRFHRGVSVVDRFPSTGLGLASARELVQSHGGTISVESEECRGSTFVVGLPLTPLAESSG